MDGWIEGGMCVVISHWVVVVLQTEGEVVVLLVGEGTLRDLADVILVRPVLLQIKCLEFSPMNCKSISQHFWLYVICSVFRLSGGYYYAHF